VSDLCFQDWTQVRAQLSAGSLTVERYVEALLAQINAHDGEVNAFLTLCAEDALTQARSLDARFARGEDPGPLAGIPYALKDIIDTEGLRTSCHSAIRAEHVPAHDAHTAARMKAAGGVLLGKLATHEFAIGGPSFDLPWPPARNPWNTAYFPGGSSSGSGAAVAAGMVPMALGTDTAGSVRNPASLCGIVGMKPTYGRVSRRGVFPLSFSLDHVGPMTRRVGENATLLNVIAGYDESDPGSANVANEDFTRGLDEGVRGLRVGVIRHFYAEDIEAQPVVRDGVDAAAQQLARLGADVIEVRTRPLREYIECNRVLLVSEAFAVHEKWLQERPQDYGALARERLSVGAFLSAVDYVQANRTKRALCAEMNTLFKGVDVLITTSSMDETCRIDDAVEVTRTYQRQSRAPFNLTGLPALSMPCGFDSNGLPLAFQIVAPAFAESLIYQVASAYEAATSWHQQQPTLGAS
jgi:aspartyl-tRNA(Asn)/glutamyl-tRNA(Gln) amidotransferase subunit A